MKSLYTQISKQVNDKVCDQVFFQIREQIYDQVCFQLNKIYEINKRLCT
jgi:hypothetical protein